MLTAAALTACGSSADAKVSNDSFCADADQLFNKRSFAADGGGVTDALRALDLAHLGSNDRESMIKAIDTVEANINAFQNGAAPDGWSTEPAATEAARICQRDMQRFFAVP